MKHYPHHISDFNNATRHLCRLERSLYRDLVELYYETEKQLPLDVPLVCRRIVANECSTDVERLLNEFFVATPIGWYHERCEEEISKYHANNSQKAQAGKASAAAKALKKQLALNGVSTSVERVLNPVDTESERDFATINHQPSTNQPEVIPVADAPRLPACPAQQIVDLYHAALPTLPAVRLLGEKRRKALTGFWKFVLTSRRTDGEPRATTAEQALAWINDYFARARDNDFLMGRGPRSGDHAGWECDIDFLVSERGLKQVIEKTRDAK